MTVDELIEKLIEIQKEKLGGCTVYAEAGGDGAIHSEPVDHVYLDDRKIVTLTTERAW